MQQSLRAPTAGKGACRSAQSRRVLCAPAFTSHTPSRGLSVQVFAKGKGKGKTAFRNSMGVPGQQMMVKQEPPTPDVDPENEEFVVFVRCMKTANMDVKGLPPSSSPWLPLSIVKGGQAANFLVKILSTEWGRKLYGNTLIRQIAAGVYKERENIERDLRRRYPPFANASSKDFEYGFKIRDKADPKLWSKADNLIPFPPPAELEVTGIQQMQKFFSLDNIVTMFQPPK